MKCTCTTKTEFVDTGIGEYEEHHVIHCPLHASAQELFDTMKKLLRGLTIAIDRNEGDTLGIAHNEMTDAMNKAEQLITLIEKKG